MPGFLVIQTAFIGDVVLATAVVEKLHRFFPGERIDFLVRKGNEMLLQNNPHLGEVLIWDKKKNKNKNLFALLKKIRKTRYDKVINLQRYFSTGMLTAFSGAKETIGFDKNPLSFLFSKKIPHRFDVAHPKHEVEKNNALIEEFTDASLVRPALYPGPADFSAIAAYTNAPYVTMTPSSVWFTKQYPVEKWIDLINRYPHSLKIFLLGGPTNVDECMQIAGESDNSNVTVLAGKLSFLQSAALMKEAAMNYTNDSGPMHFASAVNAPVTAIFCSTVPAFGYTPLSDTSFIVETKEQLSCRPCGLHGYKACPLGHFKCAHTIQTEQLLETVSIPV